MGAVRKQHPPVQHDMRLNQPKRDVPPADYSDEVTEEQIKQARQDLGDNFEDWILVDGPAW